MEKESILWGRSLLGSNSPPPWIYEIFKVGAGELVWTTRYVPTHIWFDIVDLLSLVEDCKVAHANALHFAKRKKLTYSGTKCFSMVLNGKNKVEAPNLEIDEVKKVIPAILPHIFEIHNFQQKAIILYYNWKRIFEHTALQGSL